MINRSVMSDFLLLNLTVEKVFMHDCESKSCVQITQSQCGAFVHKHILTKKKPRFIKHYRSVLRNAIAPVCNSLDDVCDVSDTKTLFLSYYIRDIKR